MPLADRWLCRYSAVSQPDHGLVKMETDSVEAIKSFVASGLGASFLPRSAVAKELSARTLRRVSLPGVPELQRSTRVVRRRDRALNATAERFLQILERGA